MQMLLLSESKKYLEIAQCDTYSQQLLLGLIPGDTLPSKLLLSVGDGDTTGSVKSRNPTMLYGLPAPWLDLCKGLLVHTDPCMAR